MGKESRARVLARPSGDGDRPQHPRLARASSISWRSRSAARRWKRALNELTFSPKRIASDVKKVLQSAIANAENNHDLDVDDLVVTRSQRRQEPGDEALPCARPRQRRRHREVLQPDHHRGRRRSAKKKKKKAKPRKAKKRGGQSCRQDLRARSAGAKKPAAKKPAKEKA